MKAKKKVLITGATGMLGSTLVKLFQQDYSVFGTGSSERGLDYFENYMSFDLTAGDFSDLLNWSNPDVIIHCAALTNGNYCDQNPQESFHINGLALKTLTQACNKGTHIIYISTDAVFPGSLRMARESDCVGPENVYGKSKELGEFFLLHSENDFTIVRTTIVGFNQNPRKNGFVEWIINSSLSNAEIGLFSDVMFTPISCTDLAEQLNVVINAGKLKNRGILHIAGNQACSKYEFGTLLLKALNFPVSNVKESSIQKFADRAKRSTDQSLDSRFFQQENNVLLPNIEKTIQTLVKEYHERK